MKESALSLGAPIPAILWESLQDSLQRSVRRLVKDVGASLGVPEKEILEELFRSGDAMVRPYLFEETTPQELDCRCTYSLQKPNAPLLIQSCGQPILWTSSGTTTRCPEHFGVKQPAAMQKSLLTLYPLQQEEGADPLFLAEDGSVYDESFTIKGHFEKGSKRLCIFHIEEQ